MGIKSFFAALCFLNPYPQFRRKYFLKLIFVVVFQTKSTSRAEKSQNFETKTFGNFNFWKNFVKFKITSFAREIFCELQQFAFLLLLVI